MDKFVFFQNYLEVAKAHGDRAGDFLLAMVEYTLNAIEPPIEFKPAIVALSISLNKHRNHGGVRAGAGAPSGNKNAIKNNQVNQVDPKQSKTINLSISTYISKNNKEKDKVSREKTVRAEKKIQPPTLREVIAYFSERDLTEQAARKFFDYYESGGWKDSGGKPVRNWKGKAIAIWDKPENHKTPPAVEPQNRDSDKLPWDHPDWNKSTKNQEGKQ